MAVKKSRKKVSPLKAKQVELQKKARAELAKAKKQYLAAEAKVKKYVKENPHKAALIAAGIGAAVGAAVALALKKKK